MRICLIPKVLGVGGMVSFQAKLIAGLKTRGIEVSDDPSGSNCDAVLITGGAHNLIDLLRLRRRGIRIVQRLDGINWLHRRLHTGMRHFLRAEYGNRLLALLRARVVTHIVYQSDFVQAWWSRQYGPERVPTVVIHNGVDLGVYSPNGSQERPTDRTRLLLVEGSLQGGYETGLVTAIDLAGKLSEKFPVELMVVGSVPADLQGAYQVKSKVPITWAGLLPRDIIPAIDRSAHLLYSADLNAACPNSVIEALACGLPVAGFATGALPELVIGDSGRLVPYGGDPWKLDPPAVPALAEAALEIVQDQPRFRFAARQRAETDLGLDRMVDRYLNVLLG
jgi:glycosyltransferase involved in cell wall biosynthesis